MNAPAGKYQKKTLIEYSNITHNRHTLTAKERGEKKNKFILGKSVKIHCYKQYSELSIN